MVRDEADLGRSGIYDQEGEEVEEVGEEGCGVLPWITGPVRVLGSGGVLLPAFARWGKACLVSL